MFSCEFCEIFYKHILYRTPPDDYLCPLPNEFLEMFV